MKHFNSPTQRKGKIGENICIKFLERKNFKILDVNFTSKYGEIDVIALKNMVIHFIEVKSLMYKTPFVSYETYNPLLNITREKLIKIKRSSFSFLRSTSVSYETYQYDMCGVYIDVAMEKHLVNFIENIH